MQKIMKNGTRVTYTIESADKMRIERIAKKLKLSESRIIRTILEDNPDEKIMALLGQ